MLQFLLYSERGDLSVLLLRFLSLPFQVALRLLLVNNKTALSRS
jgi:hypothetical protein